MIVKGAFQFDILNGLSLIMLDIKPIVPLNGPTKNAVTAPPSIATVRTCGDIPKNVGSSAPDIRANVTAGCKPVNTRIRGIIGMISKNSFCSNQIFKLTNCTVQ